MRRLRATLLLLLFLAGTSLADEKKKEDPKTKYLKAVGKMLKAGDAEGIAKHFPKEGKIQLRLRGKSGKFRDEQAKAILVDYMKNVIEPLEYKLVGEGKTTGKFSMKYKVRADGRTVKGTTMVYLRKEGESWQIVGIVES